VLDYLQEFAKENPQGNLERVAGGVEDAQVQAFMADKSKMDALLSWKQGERPLTDVEVKVTHSLMDTSYRAVVDAAGKALSAGDDASLAHLSNMLDTFKYVDNVRKGTGSAAGAALNAHKIAEDIAQMPLADYLAKQGQQAKNKMLSDAVRFGGGKENLKEMARRIKAIEETGAPMDEAMSAVVQGGTIKRMMDMAQYIAINGMLSSPKTTMANVISNAYTTANSVATNATAWVVSSARGTPNGVTVAQQSAYIRAMMGATMEGLSAAGNALRGRPAGPANFVKLEFKRANPISMNVDEEAGLAQRAFGHIVNKTGMAVGLPSRLNATPDAFFGTIMYRGNIAQQATAQAESLGLKGDEFKKFVSEKTMRPTVEMHENAKRFAEENTFSKALDPQSFLGATDNAIDKAPMGRVVLPFFKTNSNILEYTAKGSPLGYFSKDVPTLRTILSSPGTKEENLAIAKAINGSIYLGLAAYLASEGIITLPAPTNWRAKQAVEESGTGWQPDSVKVGDTYVGFNRIDPMASILRLGAVLSHLSNHVDPVEFEQMAALTGAAVADFLTPEMMVDSMSRFMEAYNEASRYGSDKSKVLSVTADIASRFVPYSALQRDIKNLKDPFRGSTAIATRDQGWLDAFTDKLIARYKSISPWFSEDLPIQRNMFGEPLMVPGGVGPDMISPFSESKGQQSRLSQQLLTLNQYFNEFSPTNPDLIPLTLDMPGRVVTFKGVNMELTDSEYERLVLYSAGYDGETGKSELREVLTPLVDQVWSQFEQEMSPRQYNKMVGKISQVIRKFRERGKMQLFAEPGFQERWNLKLKRMMETIEVTPVNVLGS